MDRIELLELSKENVKQFYKWINDQEVIKYSLSRFSKMKTKREIDIWYQKLLEDSKSINLGIYLKDTKELIGYAGISGISDTNKSGEYFIFIGEKRFWGKGIGTEVTRKVVSYGFQNTDLHRIMLTVSEPNIGGIKAYEKAGFVIEGKLRQSCFRDGEFHDKIVMSVLKPEYSL